MAMDAVWLAALVFLMALPRLGLMWKEDF